MRLRIGIDLMGGDHPPDLLFPAISQAIKLLPSHISLLVIATPSVAAHLSSFLSSLPLDSVRRVAFQWCEEVIEMADDPLAAVRLKKKSSLVLGMHALKEKMIDALVSCGNTGALIASAAMTLPLLPGVSHPALLATLPVKTGSIVILDAGGSVLNKADQLVRFAFLGAARQRIMKGIEVPRVGLLNIGVESHKGNAELRQAYESLQQYCNEMKAQGTVPEFYFSGNIEARDIFQGSIDVLVTDGFSGNILLKTVEGVSSYILESFQDALKSIAKASIADDLRKQFDYSTYPGAVVCGVQGVVIKVHGNATAETLLASIFNAAEF